MNNIINKIKYLPLHIRYLIFEYIIVDYIFDVDYVYFYINPIIFIVQESLQVSLYTWFGTRSPEKHMHGNILHTVYDRPYSINLEYNFGKISTIIYEKVKKFKLKSNFSLLQKIRYAGTYGPLRENDYNENDYNNYFNKLSDMSYHYNTINILDYFKENSVINSNIYELDDDIISIGIRNLEKKIVEYFLSFKYDYNKISKNIIVGYEEKKETCNNHTSSYFFFKLYKNISDSKYLLKKQFNKTYLIDILLNLKIKIPEEIINKILLFTGRFGSYIPKNIS